MKPAEPVTSTRTIAEYPAWVYSAGMALSDGVGRGSTYALGPHNGRLVVRTSRPGLGRRAGHDLTIEAAQWSGSATVDLADPAGSAVRAEIEVDALEVREGTGGV